MYRFIFCTSYCADWYKVQEHINQELDIYNSHWSNPLEIYHLLYWLFQIKIIIWFLALHQVLWEEDVIKSQIIPWFELMDFLYFHSNYCMWEVNITMFSFEILHHICWLGIIMFNNFFRNFFFLVVEDFKFINSLILTLLIWKHRQFSFLKWYFNIAKVCLGILLFWLWYLEELIDFNLLLI